MYNVDLIELSDLKRLLNLFLVVHTNRKSMTPNLTKLDQLLACFNALMTFCCPFKRNSGIVKTSQAK